MPLQRLEVQVPYRRVASLADDDMATSRALRPAHAHAPRRARRDQPAPPPPPPRGYDLLWTLRRQPQRRLRVNELAREVALSPTAMSRFVDRVEAAGCVRREPDPADRRALQVVLTAEGEALLRRMWPVYADGIERYF